MIAIRRVAAGDESVRQGLCELLVDAVDGGASIGFLAPFAQSRAREYWSDVFREMPGGLALWIAEEQGKVVGTIQLNPCRKDNAPHRAEVQKLFVLGSQRGRGIASKLLAEVEAFARADGRTLLVLDTEKASVAESVYRRRGWQRAGEIPNYALTPSGAMHSTVYYYKLLD
jgi:acetyltransferase